MTADKKAITWKLGPRYHKREALGEYKRRQKPDIISLLGASVPLIVDSIMITTCFL